MIDLNSTIDHFQLLVHGRIWPFAQHRYIFVRKMKFLQFFLALALVGVACGQRISYENYHVYRLTPQDVDQVNFLKSLGTGIEFWRECSVPGRSCDILLSPVQQKSILPAIAGIGINFDVFVDDVGGLVESSQSNLGNGRISWDAYYGVEDIYNFLDEQSASHDTIASVHTIGRSIEGRDLKLIKIAKNSNGTNPIIFVEANTHAREWISNAVATYLINELLNSQNPDIQQWTEDFDWYIIPVFNPDGLEHTRNVDRMWRKNRRNSTTPLCRGVDLNRNFDYNWCGVGASPDPCSNTHCGTGPASEPETQSLTSFVEGLGDDLVFYLAVHSYSQYIMFPYGDRVDDSFYDSHMQIASDAAAAAEVRHGTVFTPGNWLDILYESTGDSMDWAKNSLNVSLSFTYELRDTGRYGFILPPEQIIPSGEEFVDSLKPVIEALRNGVQ